MKPIQKTIIAAMATAVIVISGAFLSSCQKEETLTANNEEITSEKQQKYFEGRNENVSIMVGYMDATGKPCTMVMEGVGFVYWYRGVKYIINFRPINILYFSTPPPPSGNPSSLPSDISPILTLNLEGMLKDDCIEEFVNQIEKGEDAPENIRNFESYTIKINENELTTDFQISKEYIGEDGNISELKIDYYTIKNDVFPLIIESLMGTE
jgi:hypothetical protein